MHGPTEEVYLQLNGRVCQQSRPGLANDAGLDIVLDTDTETRFDRWLVTVLVHERGQDDRQAVVAMLRKMADTLDSPEGWKEALRLLGEHGPTVERKRRQLDSKRAEWEHERRHLQEFADAGPDFAEMHQDQARQVREIEGEMAALEEEIRHLEEAPDAYHLDAWRRWYRDPERGGGCWCPSYPPCRGEGKGPCPNMPADVREEGERLWRQADPTQGEREKE